MSRIPEIVVKTSRNSEISPRPNVYVALNGFICDLIPWIWRNKLVLVTAALDLSDVGMPVLIKEPRKELLIVFKFSLNLSIPD